MTELYPLPVADKLVLEDGVLALPVRQGGGGTITTGQLPVSTAAALLIDANLQRYRLTITNAGASAVYIGSAAVTLATGHAIPAGGSVVLTSTAALYALAAASGDTLTYLEEAV